MTTKTQTADDAYTEAHVVALDMIDQIRDQVEDMPALGNTWSNVADLNRIKAMLAEILTVTN